MKTRLESLKRGTQTGWTIDRPETPATKQAPQQRNTSAAAETFCEDRHFPEKSCHADSIPAPAASPSWKYIA